VRKGLSEHLALASDQIGGRRLVISRPIGHDSSVRARKRGALLQDLYRGQGMRRHVHQRELHVPRRSGLRLQRLNATSALLTSHRGRQLERSGRGRERRIVKNAASRLCWSRTQLDCSRFVAVEPEGDIRLETKRPNPHRPRSEAAFFQNQAGTTSGERHERRHELTSRPHG